MTFTVRNKTFTASPRTDNSTKQCKQMPRSRKVRSNEKFKIALEAGAKRHNTAISGQPLVLTTLNARFNQQNRNLRCHI
jgi:hypothetical protein